MARTVIVPATGTNAGSIMSVGRNNYGQLGDGTNTDRTSPVGFRDKWTVSAIAAGVHHTCALLSSGTMKCWGRNYYGSVGDGTETNRFYNRRRPGTR